MHKNIILCKHVYLCISKMQISAGIMPALVEWSFVVVNIVEGTSGKPE
jgi:hypothetical protein